MDIFLIRHGETTANLDKRWQGQTDAPLSERGQAQVAALGERLREAHFDARVSSDLGRAAATARAALGEHVAHDKAFREAGVGEWEGLSIHEVLSRYPEQLRALMNGELDVRLGGGETLREFHARLDDGIARLFTQYGAGARVAVVSHGGAIAALVARALNTRQSPAAKTLARISNTSITVMRIEHAHDAGKLLTFNDAHHLDVPASLRSEGDRHDEHVILRASSTDAAPESAEQLLPLFAAKSAQFAAPSLLTLTSRLAQSEASCWVPLQEQATLRVIHEGGVVRLADYNVKR